jgi:hypothetical protein
MIHTRAARSGIGSRQGRERRIYYYGARRYAGQAEITVAASFSPRHLSHTHTHSHARIICCVPFPFGVSGFSVMNSDAAKSHSTNSASGGNTQKSKHKRTPELNSVDECAGPGNFLLLFVVNELGRSI